MTTPAVPTLPDCSGLFGRFRRSMTVRLLALASLILTLRIPIALIDDTIAERQSTRDEAVREVTATWGGPATVRGPVLLLPFVERWHDGKKVVERREVRHVLPERLEVEGRIEPEVRRRGLFDVPLYLAHVTLSGTFRKPAGAFTFLTASVAWSEATVALGVADPRAIRERVTLDWSGAPIALQPGPGAASFLDAGLSAAVPIDTTAPAGAVIPFRIELVLAGSETFDVLPVGAETVVHLTSPWTTPSFTGAFLPVTHTETPDGFDASWRVLDLARNVPAAWDGASVREEQLDKTLFGVGLFVPVDAYRTTERAVKYQLLVIGLTFLAFMAVEVLGGLRLHAVQYLLVGLALCLFYLLLLSLAEHVGFHRAYFSAAIAIGGLVTGYSRAVLRTRRRGAAIAVLLAGVYAFLYVLLQVQDYALLAGSVASFLVLAVVMRLTRHVDWHRLGDAEPESAPAAAS